MNSPTWRNTFESEHRRYGYIGAAVLAALDAGYQYLHWNGRIYKIFQNLEVVDTGLVTVDLN